MNLKSECFRKSLEHDFITFQKIVKLAFHLIEKIESKKPIPPRWEVHIIYSVELFSELESIVYSDINRPYDWEEDIPWSVFLLLEAYLKCEFVSDELSDSSDQLTQRSIVYSAYERLGQWLWKEVDDSLRDAYGVKLNTDERPFAEKYINVLFTVCEILDNQIWDTAFIESGPETRKYLEDFLVILEDNGIISDNELEVSISRADIHQAIYDIIRGRLIKRYIPEESQVHKSFQKLTSKYWKYKIDWLKKIVSDSVIERVRIHEIWELLRLIFDEYEWCSADNQSCIKIWEMLCDVWVISQRQKNILQISDSRDTYLQYLTFLLKDNWVFLSQLSPESEVRIKMHFQEYQFSNWWFWYQFRLWNRNKSLREIESRTEHVIKDLMREWKTTLTLEYLTEFVCLLEQTIQHKSAYLRLIKADYDEISSLPKPLQKAIQILWIIVFDVIDNSHPLYVRAAELLINNTLSIKNRTAILHYLSGREIEKEIYHNSWNNWTVAKEKVVVTKSQQLYYWMKEIIYILESWSIEDESDYLAQFYAFLCDKDFFSKEELQGFLIEGWDLEIVLEITEEVFIRSFMREVFDGELELFDTFLEILENLWEHDRYKRLMNIFPSDES